ncbi:MAG: mechanosensitive ion channel family protein [Patescibacteria group bacterium]
MLFDNFSFFSVSSKDLSTFLFGVILFFSYYALLYGFFRMFRVLLNRFNQQGIQLVFKQNLNTTNWIFCNALAIKSSLETLMFIELNSSIRSSTLFWWLENLSFVVISYFIIIISQQWLIYLFKVVVENNQKNNQRFDPEGLSLITTLIRFVVWIIGLILVLQNFEIRGVQTLITSLGITGIAVAFSLQNILSEIFASFSIFLDKPFIVGDYVEIGQDRGYVQSIGLRSTRIRVLSGEELVVSNKELINTRIHNFKLLKSRRVDFSLHLDLKTPLNKLKLVPGLIQKVIESQEGVRFQRVSFMEIGNHKFRFEVVYHVLSNDYMSFTIAQQNINYAIMEKLEQKKIELVMV